MGWLVRPLRGRIENAQHQKALAKLERVAGVKAGP